MNEHTQQVSAALKIVWLAGYAYFYGFGGMAGTRKAWRRFAAPAWLVAGVFAFGYWSGLLSFPVDLWAVSAYPLMVVALSVGYGDDSTLVHAFGKYGARAMIGMILAVSAAPVAFVSGSWRLMAFHAGLCVFSSLILGAFNINRNSRDEESLIAAISGIVPLFMV